MPSIWYICAATVYPNNPNRLSLKRAKFLQRTLFLQYRNAKWDFNYEIFLEGSEIMQYHEKAPCQPNFQNIWVVLAAFALKWNILLKIGLQCDTTCFHHKKQLVTSFERGFERLIPRLTMGLPSRCEISQFLWFLAKKNWGVVRIFLIFLNIGHFVIFGSQTNF